MLRLINCQNATLLLERQADHALDREQRVNLWVHLRYCAHCKRYAEQTVLIAQWASAVATRRAQTGPALSATAKQRMQERLAAAQ